MLPCGTGLCGDLTDLGHRRRDGQGDAPLARRVPPSRLHELIKSEVDQGAGTTAGLQALETSRRPAWSRIRSMQSGLGAGAGHPRAEFQGRRRDGVGVPAKFFYQLATVLDTVAPLPGA